MREIKRLALGLFLAPLVFAGVVALLMYFLVMNEGMYAFGLWLYLAKPAFLTAATIAYAHVLVFGPPWYWLLRKTNQLKMLYVLGAGFVTGMVTGPLCVMWMKSSKAVAKLMWEMLGLGVFFGGCGIGVALLIWWIGIEPEG